jgi:phosphoribosylglycinamide formyltransferase 1
MPSGMAYRELHQHKDARVTPAKKRLGILISGRGSNMRSLVEAARAPDYPVEVAVVISNRPDAEGLTYAKEQNIPALGLDHKRYESREHFEGQLQTVLTASKVDLVACAGFMRLMTPQFVDNWRDRMLNIHPSLLPLFKGLNTHERAIEAGVCVAGCTVHLVRAGMDEGPILAQAAVPVIAGDTAETLGARVLAAEHVLYPHALAMFARGDARVEGEKIVFNQSINQNGVLFSPALPIPANH